MARYQVHIEIGRDGSCMAHVEELVGCFAMGPSVEEALAALRQEIPRYLDWLAEQGERPEGPAGPIELKVVEEVRSEARFPSRPEEPVVDFFSHDAAELTSSDLHAAMRLMEQQRRELLEFLKDAPQELLEWRPSPEEQSVLSLLLHMAHAEAYYLAHLEEQVHLYPFLDAVRSWAYHRLSRLSEEDRRRVVDHRGERWSARKVLRRFLEHEREHFAQIRTLVARYGRRTEG